MHTRRTFIKGIVTTPFIATRLTAGTTKIVRQPYVKAGQTVSMINWEPYKVSERFIGSALVEMVSDWNPATKSYHVILRNQGYRASTPFMGVNGHFVADLCDAAQYSDEDLSDFRAEGIYASNIHPLDLGYKNWHEVILARRSNLT